MTPVEDMLIDLIQMAEAPLYPTYKWFGREVGRDPSLEEFLRLLDEMLGRGLVRLWSVRRSGEAEELFEVPPLLADQYRAVPLADTYDPFGLTLTLGDAADPAQRPPWAIDFDFDEGTFQLRVPQGEEEIILEQIQRLLPDVCVLVKTMTHTRGGVVLTGDVELR